MTSSTSPTMRGVQTMLSMSPNKKQNKRVEYVKALAHLSIIRKVEYVDVASMYMGVCELIADLHLG